MSGKIWMELEDGEEVVLNAGTCSRSAAPSTIWVNRGDEVCRAAFITLASQRIAAGGGELHAEG